MFAAIPSLTLCTVLLAGCIPAAGIGGAKAELLANDETCVVIRVTEGDASKSLYDMLVVFDEAGDIAIGGSDSEYEYYLTSLNGTEADNEHYWAVYTTLGELDGVSYSNAEYGTWEYEGETLASASYGVSGLPLAEDALFAIVWTSLDS